MRPAEAGAGGEPAAAESSGHCEEVGQGNRAESKGWLGSFGRGRIVLRRGLVRHGGGGFVRARRLIVRAASWVARGRAGGGQRRQGGPGGMAGSQE